MALCRKDTAKEAKKQLWLAGPMISVSVFQNSLQMISLMFVGHLGDLPLSGASMATSFLNATGFGVLMGLASALDTFCGQSYGAEQYHMLGIHMQRGILVILLVTLAQSIIWANLRPILVALHQDHNIAKEAGVYARYMIPSLSANGILQCNIKFLQNQKIVFPMVLTTGITSFMHILFCWVLVLKSGLGTKGAALAICISNWLSMLLLALYIKYSSSCKRTWTGFSRESLHNIPQFLQLALPSSLMVCLESWTFELMVIMSGTFPNPKLETSVSSICLNTSNIFWMIPYGIGAAARSAFLTREVCFLIILLRYTTLPKERYIYGFECIKDEFDVNLDKSHYVSQLNSTRISNELGSGYPKAAYLAVEVALFFSLTAGVLESSLLMIMRNIWVLLLRMYMKWGCGWQKLGAFVNLGSYYLVGVPFAIVFAIVFDMTVKGLWLGIIMALAVQVVFPLLVTVCANWEKEAKKAEIRVQGPRLPASGQNITI